MESNELEYRLEEYTGKIYTWEEFWEEYKGAMPDAGVLQSAYSGMTLVPTQGLDIKEVRRKLEAVYASPIKFQVGDIVKYDLTSRKAGIVKSVWGKLEIEDIGGKQWEEERGIPLIIIASASLDFSREKCGWNPSLVDKMKSQQVMYNVTMNELGK